MRKKVPYIGQLLMWLVGLVTGGLLLQLPIKTANRELATGWQTYISFISPWEEADEFDYSPTDSIQARSILLNPLSGFSFGPSAGFFSYVRCIFHRTLRLDLAIRQPEAYWVFGFLHLFFEHQIAINAP